MKSNNIELVNDVIDFIISDSPDFWGYSVSHNRRVKPLND